MIKLAVVESQQARKGTFSYYKRIFSIKVTLAGMSESNKWINLNSSTFSKTSMERIGKNAILNGKINRR